MSDRVSMWTLELWALPVNIWSPLNEAAQLSIYMGVCIYSRAVNIITEVALICPNHTL